MFNDALEDLLQGVKLFDPKIVKPVLTKKKDGEHVIGGAAVAPAAPREEVLLELQNAMPEEHQYPPLQPALEPATPEKFGKQMFLETNQPVAPIQVHFDSPEPVCLLS